MTNFKEDQSSLEPKAGSTDVRGTGGSSTQKDDCSSNHNGDFKPKTPHGKGSEGYHGKGNDKDKNKKKRYNNDVQWYMQSKVLAQQAGSISTAHINGFNYGLNTFGIPHVETTGKLDCGVRMAGIAITPSHSTDVGDPYNQARINLFNFIRGKYTSNVPFQANDLGCYFMAVGNIIAALSETKRAIDAVQAWSKLTKDLASLEYTAAGYAGDLMKERQQVAQNLLTLNLLQTRLDCLALPRSMSFFKRCAWITRFFYFDDAVGYDGNIYGYRLDFRYKFDSEVPTHDQPTLKATGLRRVQINKTSIAAALESISGCIDALVNDDNARQISGWLMQYYKDFIFTTEYLKIGEGASAAFSAEISNQFANIKTSEFGVVRPDTIPQDIGKQCLYNPTNTIATKDYKHAEVVDGWIMRSKNMSPSVDEVLVGTRLTAASVQIEGGSVTLYTDLFVAYNLIYIHYAGTTIINQFVDTADESVTDMLSMTHYIASAPTLALGETLVDPDDSTDIRITALGRFVYPKEKTYSVSGSDLVKMHRVCILSQFGIPAATTDPLSAQR